MNVADKSSNFNINNIFFLDKKKNINIDGVFTKILFFYFQLFFIRLYFEFELMVQFLK